MAKMFAYIFSTSRQYPTGCCRSTVLTATYYCLPNHCIPAQMFWPMFSKLNHNCSP